jgi:hypothetical protein
MPAFWYPPELLKVSTPNSFAVGGCELLTLVVDSVELHMTE